MFPAHFKNGCVAFALTLASSNFLTGCIESEPYPGDFYVAFDEVCISFIAYNDVGDTKPNDSKTQKCVRGWSIGGTLDYEFNALVWINGIENEQLLLHAEGVQITDLVAHESALTPPAGAGADWGPNYLDLLDDGKESDDWSVLVGTSDQVDDDSLLYTYNVPFDSPIVVRFYAERP